MEDDGAEQIAAEWNVDVETLLQAHWQLEELEGNDGESYGYLVRFADDTDPKLLSELGVRSGEFVRELSLNAFDDSEIVKALTFNKLSRANQIEEMVEWFGQNFEDPAMRTPYETREGGYQWIWGGPYNALEQLSDEFGDKVDFGAIEEAARLVEKDGVLDWAPVASDDDYEEIPNEDYAPDTGSLAGLAEVGTPSAGTAIQQAVTVRDSPITFRDNRVTISRHETEGQRPEPELPLGPFSYLTDENGNFLTDENGDRLIEQYAENLRHRREIENNLAVLDKAVEDLRYLAINRSHNNPPELVDEISVSSADIAQIKATVDELRSELKAALPNIQNVEKQRSVLGQFGNDIKYLIEEYALKGVGIVIGIDAFKGDYVILNTLYKALTDSVHAVATWVQYLQGLGLS